MRPARRGVWWLWPAVPLVLLVAPTLIAASMMSESLYLRAWRTPKGLDGALTTLQLAVVVAIVGGSLVVALSERDRSARPGVDWPRLDQPTVALLRRAYPILIGLTLFGYTVWIGRGIARGLTLADVEAVLASQDNFKLPIKDKLDTLPGITTLTQAAIPAAIVGVLLDVQRPDARIRFSYRLVILLAAARGFLLAERLAIAEIVLPVLVIRAAVAARRSGPRGQVLLAIAPLLAVGLLLSAFTVSEYSRSWNWYSGRTDRSFVDFASERLLGYYATSHNNGALLLEHGEVADVPFHTTSFLWQIPPGSQIGAEIADDVSDDRRRVLRTYGNPEFNSPGGLASILVDYGTTGGLAFAFGIGLVFGGLHLAFVHGRLLGVLLYPVVFTGLLELPRYLYLFQGRAVPAIGVPLVLVMVRALIQRRTSRRLALLASLPSSPRPTGVLR